MYAGVAIPVYNIEEPKIPLRLACCRNLFKLFQSDCGLLAARYADGIQMRILKGDKDINFGSMSNIMGCGEYDLPEAIVFNNDDLHVKKNIIHAPIYMLMFLVQNETAPEFYKIDLSGL